MADLLSRLTSKDGVSDTIIPSTIVEGIPKLDMGHLNIAFGSYVMVHIGITNTSKIRCVPEIELKAPNYSGGYYFMNIFIGKQMYSYNW